LDKPLNIRAISSIIPATNGTIAEYNMSKVKSMVEEIIS